jgi:hypothetical protein
MSSLFREVMNQLVTNNCGKVPRGAEGEISQYDISGIEVDPHALVAYMRSLVQPPD